MNGTTEIRNKDRNQAKICQDSKKLGGKSAQQIRRKMKNGIHFFRVRVKWSALTKTCEILAVKRDVFIVFSGHSLYE